MVIPYIYSTCWCMKSMFYDRQHGDNKNKNKEKARGNHQSLAGTPTAAATAAAADGDCGPRGDKHPRQAFGNDESGVRCSVHNSMRHSTGGCQEIKKLTEQFHEK
jgi:hypothetical protein